jgi:DNA-binding NtrC family response regulator
VLVVYSTFKWMLPALAAVTPPGVDLEAVEKGLLRQALARTAGNQSAAARLLGITRYALRYRMDKFGFTA